MVFIKSSRMTIKKGTSVVCSASADSMLSLHNIQKTDIAANYTPCGESTVVIDRSTTGADDLLALDPSEYENLTITIEHKWSDRTSYTPAALHYIDDIREDKAEGTITIHSYDILYRLGKSKFGGINIQYDSAAGKPYENELEYWVGAVANYAHIGATNIPEYMETATSSGFIPESTYREALRLIAEAAACALYVDVDGTVSFGDPIHSPESDPDVALSLDDIVDSTMKDSVKTENSAVNVSVYTFSAMKTQSGLATQKDVIVPANSSIRIRIDYDVYPAVVDSVIVGNTNVIVSTSDPNYSRYPSYCNLILTNPTSAPITTFVTLLGREYLNSEQSKVYGVDDPKNETVEIQNPLITGTDLSLFVGSLHRDLVYGNPRHAFEIFGARVALLDWVQLGTSMSIIADRVETTLSGKEYKIIVEGYENYYATDATAFSE